MNPEEAAAAEEVVSQISVSSGLVVAIVAVGILTFAVFRELYRSLKPTPPLPDTTSTEPPQMTIPVTESELREATGGNDRPLYVAVKDPFSENITVFDVSTGSDFYGPGGPYHVFAGNNATHGLATSSTAAEKVTGDLSNLTASQKDTHMQWYAKFSSKYPIVGNLVQDGQALSDANDDTTSTVTTESKKDA